MDSLSDIELQRQDFVDNSIQELLNDINPTEAEIKWDIEQISRIREVIQDVLVNTLKLTTEREFYPFLEEF